MAISIAYLAIQAAGSLYIDVCDQALHRLPEM